MHCDRVMQITIDSNLRVSIREDEAEPLLFMPDVNWENFAERTIIDAY